MRKKDRNWTSRYEEEYGSFDEFTNNYYYDFYQKAVDKRRNYDYDEFRPEQDLHDRISRFEEWAFSRYSNLTEPHD